MIIENNRFIFVVVGTCRCSWKKNNKLTSLFSRFFRDLKNGLYGSMNHKKNVTISIVIRMFYYKVKV